MKKKIAPYLLLTPMILIMGVLVFYPIITTFTYSLKKWKLTSPGDIRFIGLKNYRNILQSDSFWYSMQNTVYILVLVIVLTTILGCLVAAFLKISKKCSGILLALAILPWALPPFVNGILWKFVFFSGYGFLNKLLIGIGAVEKPVEFLASRWLLLFVISIVVVWRSVPFMALVCLAGRQSLPEDVYEAAEISPSDSSCAAYLEKCAAYQIALQAVPELASKAKLFLPMPMIKDKTALKEIHDRDASAAAKLLEEGKDMVFLTLGDPTVYSTCMYVHKRLARAGFLTALVPGIPSFCAAAARLDMPLAENREEIHILPASYGIEESLHLEGTKILMKAGRKMPEVKKILVERKMDARMVQNCGMEDEQIFNSAEEIPEQAGYYSLLIVKEGKGGEKR